MKRLKLNKDSKGINVSNETLSDATNIVVSEDLGSIVHEKGNKHVDNVGTIYGYTSCIDNSIILFHKLNTTFYVSILYNNVLKTLIGSSSSKIATFEVFSELRFDDTVQADTISYQDKQIVVWTDGVNPIRYYEFELPDIQDINVSFRRHGNNFLIIPNEQIEVKVNDYSVGKQGNVFIIPYRNENIIAHIFALDGRYKRVLLHE